MTRPDLIRLDMTRHDLTRQDKKKGVYKLNLHPVPRCAYKYRTLLWKMSTMPHRPL